MSAEDTLPDHGRPIIDGSVKEYCDDPGTTEFLENILLGMALFALAVCVFIPAFTGGFLWSDDQLLTANPQVHSPNGWWTLWLQPQTVDYFPLTSTTVWLEWRHWGMNAVGYHVTNVLLHGIAVVMTWLALKRLLIPGAWVAAAIFAVHPVCVESVAWIAERTNLISQIFLLLTIIAYLRFKEKGGLVAYLCALVCFTLALFAKTSGVMLPFILLLLDWWRGRKLEPIRLIPFFAVALLLGLVTVYFQFARAIGFAEIPIGNWWQRIASACFAVGFYLYSAVFPFTIIPVYPQWHRVFSEIVFQPWLHVQPPAPESIPYWLQVLPGLVNAGLLLFCWRRRTEPLARAVLVALGCYILALLPVLGLVTMAYMRITLVADHYQYICLIAVIAPAVAGASSLSPKVFRLCVPFILCLFAFISWREAAIFHSEKTFFTAVLRKNPNNWQAHNHLGAALYMEGDAKGAAPHFAEAVRLMPENPESHNNLGLTLSYFGHMDEAIHEFETAVAIKDDSAMRTNLANAYEQVKQYDKAVENYLHAIKMNDNNASAHCNLGYALMCQGRVDAAIAEFMRTVELDPAMPQGRADLAQALKLKGINLDAPAPKGSTYRFDVQGALELLKPQTLIRGHLY